MLKFTGKGVYGAIAVGKASVFFKKKKTKIRRTGIVDIEAEFARVEAAKAKAAEELSLIYEKALREVGETNAQIFEIHMMMLEDDDYNESIRHIIETQSVNAEYAVHMTAVCPEADLRQDIGINSIGLLYMAMAIEEAFGIKFTNDDFTHIKTVADVVATIEEKTAR